MCHSVRNGTNMQRCGAAAATHDIQEATSSKLRNEFSHFLSALVILSKLVGKTCIRVCGHEGIGDTRDLFDMRAQLRSAQGTVETYGDRLGMGYRVPKGFDGLAGECAPAGIGNGARDHDGNLSADALAILLNCEDCCLGVQGIENGFDQ